MISNSVTHLQSYTNTAITNITGNSSPMLPEILCERQYRLAEPQCLRAERRCLCIECGYRRIEWRVLECFMMFPNVLRVS